MATSPQFTTQPTVDVAVVPLNQATTTTIQANMKLGTAGDSNYTLVCSGPSGSPGSGVGKRISRARICRAQSTTSTQISTGVLCFYYKANTSTTGANDYRLIAEVYIPSTSFSASTAQESIELYEVVGFTLPAGSGIYANYLTNTVGNLIVTFEGGLL